MEVKAKWNDGLSYESVGVNSGHSVVMDAGVKAGGEGKAPSPMEMLLHGVAGCMGIDINNFIRHRIDGVDSIEIHVDAEQNEEFPKYFTDVAITVTAEGSIDGKHIKRAVELSHEKYCSAINSLKANSRVNVIYNGEEL